MPTRASRVLAAHLLLVAACAVLCSRAQAHHRGGCFARVFSFGDSIIDNGNWLRYASDPGGVANLPNGETFFGRPNGRFSDGRVIIDFITEALGLPFLTPYLAGSSSQDFENGANFAVGGATALDKDFFAARKMDDAFTLYSLQWQMALFKNVTRMLATDEEGLSDLMATSLFLVGEIGGNDYNRPFLRQKHVDEVTPYIPDVVAAIISAVNELIELGAKTLFVPGIFPLGCSPGYLEMFRTNDTAQYDALGCLRWANNLAELHNNALMAQVADLSLQHPGVTVVYADYYAAVSNLVANPAGEGFDDQPLVSCCGGGGPYNVNFSIPCGTSQSTACKDPGVALSWDGFHFTEHAYKVVADGILQGPYAEPPILASCGIAGTGL